MEELSKLEFDILELDELDELELSDVIEELFDGGNVLFDVEEFSESEELVELLGVSELSGTSLFVQAVSKRAEIKMIAVNFFISIFSLKKALKDFDNLN